MLKQFKKFKRLILKSTLKTKSFLILFALFFSSLAFAATLTVTRIDGRIPIHDTEDPPFSNIIKCKNSAGEFDMDTDSTEDPLDVAFSTDGLQVFTANQKQESERGKGNLSMNRLMEPFDVSRSRIRVNGIGDCNDIDSFKITTLAGVSSLNKGERLRNMVVADEGRKFFFSNNNGIIMRFDLSTPNEFKTNTFVQSVETHAQMHGFAFSDDGTKLITIRFTIDTPLVTTYQLPNPYDISSITQIHQVDLTDIGITLPTGSGNNLGRDIEFSKSGHAMFVLIQYSVNTPEDKSDIYHFNLEKKFDVSTATFVGNYDVNNLNTANGLGHPVGFTFSSDGMRMFMVQINGGAGVDQINSYQLECPYGLVACVSDPTASIGSQVELAKQNIALNISTIFKRFEWIKRNRDEEDLSSHKINLNYPNPLLEALALNLEPSAKKTVASLVSKNQKDKKKSKWSTWSLGDIYIGNFEKLGFENAKSIKAKGVTIGADRKFGENKFFGWAIRYGDNKSNIYSSQQNTEMESLTLNLYGITPTKDNKYINAVVGLSALRIDSIYLGKISGRRNGQQAFSSINLRTKNNYGKLNITPSGKFTYGITRLSEYTDFISMTIDGPTTDVRYESDTFESGELAAGILFETEKFETERGSFRPMGAINLFYDFTPDIHYNYSLQGSSQVNQETITGAYSKRNLRTSIGFESIYGDGYTVTPIYEKVSKIERGKIRQTISETFIIKLSRTKEENNSSFALNFDPLSNKPANLSYTKKVNGFDVKLNTNYLGFNNNIDYFTNFEISGTF